VCAAALALRVAYVLVLGTGALAGGDAYQYHQGANLLVDGKGFVSAFPGLASRPTAQHPPLYTVVLALASLLGFRSPLAHQLWSCLIGMAAVGVTGLVGRQVAGPRAGLLAAAIIAVYPNAWILDGLLAAETLSLLAAAAVLLAAYRLWERRSAGAAAALGAACAAAALTRAEALLFLPLVLVPFALAGDPAASGGRRRRLGLAALATVVALVVMAPWTAYNLRRFHRPLLGTSSGFDLALVQGNCDEAYYGKTIGYYSIGCIPTAPVPGDETDDDAYYRRVALRYVGERWARVPFVVYARLGRLWGFYRPVQQVELEAYIQARRRTVGELGLASFYLLAAGAVAGGAVLRRRGMPVSPLVAMLVTVSVAAAMTWGESRYRVSAEPALVVLAAVAADDALGGIAQPRRSGGGILSN